MTVDIAFPIFTYTESTRWTLAAADIPTRIASYVREFRRRFGKRPDAMRMTTDTWNVIKRAKSVKDQLLALINITIPGPNAGAIPNGIITPDFVVKAFDWPPIEIMDASTMITYVNTNAESTGSSVVVETPNTWGLSVGDTILCNYNLSDDIWQFSATVTAVVDGVSFTLDSIPSAGLQPRA